MPPHPPTLQEERRLWQRSCRRVAGVDEAGRGALAGPVAAAAVILPPETALEGIWAQVRDSKLLSSQERERLAQAIQAAALDWSVGMASAQEIDRMGIAAATRLAMQRAVEGLSQRPDYLLVDWMQLPGVNIPQERFVKGDQRIVSIAAASILAKVHRDRWMVALDARYPGYGFARHKGYGTPEHREALARLGPCPEHRHSFAPIARPATLFDSQEEDGSQEEAHG